MAEITCEDATCCSTAGLEIEWPHDLNAVCHVTVCAARDMDVCVVNICQYTILSVSY